MSGNPPNRELKRMGKQTYGKFANFRAILQPCLTGAMQSRIRFLLLLYRFINEFFEFGDGRHVWRAQSILAHIAPDGRALKRPFDFSTINSKGVFGWTNFCLRMN